MMALELSLLYLSFYIILINNLEKLRVTASVGGGRGFRGTLKHVLNG